MDYLLQEKHRIQSVGALLYSFSSIPIQRSNDKIGVIDNLIAPFCAESYSYILQERKTESVNSDFQAYKNYIPKNTDKKVRSAISLLTFCFKKNPELQKIINNPFM